MPIHVTTVYTKKALTDFIKYSAASKKIFWAIIIICNILLLGDVALAAVLHLLSTTLILCSALLVWIDLVYIFAFLILPRLTLKKSKQLNTVVEYAFSEDSFEMHAKNDYIDDSTTAKYTALYKIGKKGAALYLYISRSQAFIADLSSLTEDQIALLKTALESNLPAKKIKWRP